MVPSFLVSTVFWVEELMQLWASIIDEFKGEKSKVVFAIAAVDVMGRFMRLFIQAPQFTLDFAMKN